MPAFGDKDYLASVGSDRAALEETKWKERREEQRQLVARLAEFEKVMGKKCEGVVEGSQTLPAAWCSKTLLEPFSYFFIVCVRALITPAVKVQYGYESSVRDAAEAQRRLHGQIQRQEEQKLELQNELVKQKQV
jgi:hypothetical protein